MGAPAGDAADGEGGGEGDAVDDEGVEQDGGVELDVGGEGAEICPDGWTLLGGSGFNAACLRP